MLLCIVAIGSKIYFSTQVCYVGVPQDIEWKLTNPSSDQYDSIRFYDSDAVLKIGWVHEGGGESGFVWYWAKVVKKLKVPSIDLISDTVLFSAADKKDPYEFGEQFEKRGDSLLYLKSQGKNKGKEYWVVTEKRSTRNRNQIITSSLKTLDSLDQLIKLWAPQSRE